MDLHEDEAVSARHCETSINFVFSAPLKLRTKQLMIEQYAENSRHCNLSSNNSFSK